MNNTLLNIENINELIIHWREKIEEASCPNEKLIARCYVDAFQTVRLNHNLPLLPKDD